MDRFNQTNKYDDIINLPHHVSAKHTHMSLIDRAAQFSPFAALTGHNEAIKETARLTDSRIELDEDEKVLLNERLHVISDNLHNQPTVSITYFKPDDKKSGGAYLTACGVVKKIDEYERHIKMVNGTIIPFDDIIKIDGDLF
jgi:hypothetical protein